MPATVTSPTVRVIEQSADSATFAVFDCDRPIGQVTAMLNSALRYQHETCGLLAFFECENDPQAAELLLDAACAQLRNWGCRWAIGPMDGSTWHSYRLRRPGGKPAFFMDVEHPDYYYNLFAAAGFDSVGEYKTTRITSDCFAFARVGRCESILAKRGVTVRPVTSATFTEDLQKIYDISVASFRNNFLYSDIDSTAFAALYSKIEALIDDCFVLIAEATDGRPLGFIFTVPNLYRSDKSWVIKTVAVVPDAGGRGIGSYLVERVHQAAHEQGVSELFHALMHCDNVSTRIGGESELHAQYTLFGRALAAPSRALEYWSSGVMGEDGQQGPALQHSNTPSLRKRRGGDS
jgi:GNAT superfamily N-acetyltransferase